MAGREGFLRFQEMDGEPMGYQDRYYYRDSQSARSNPLMWLLSGSVHLFTVWGIRVRAHAALLLLVALTLLIGGSKGYDFQDRAVSMTILFLVVLLHEFGHCFAARAVGGYADDILMWPLGGLADAQPPHRPLATFLTVAAGPAVNVALCAVAAASIYGISQIPVPTSPEQSLLAPSTWNWTQPAFYLWYVYAVSYAILLFNLLPIFPLDGGQILHTILWPWVGYGKAMLATCTIGIGASIVVGAYGLYTGSLLITMIMAMCLFHCIQKRAVIKAAGVWSFDEFDVSHHHRRHHLSRFTKWRARRQIRQEESDQKKVDAILEKVHMQGMHSLTWWEKRTLKRATDRQRQREMEESRRPG